MSPFKDPQPRKNVPVQDSPRLNGGVWPGPSTGGITHTPQPQPKEWGVIDFDYRQTALQLAITWNNGEVLAAAVVEVAAVFENYLRNGKHNE